MCDVTDVRSKVPTDWSKSSSPQDVHFLTHFYFHRNEITLSICGDTSFLPSFLRSNVIFKAISHISGSKKWSKRRGEGGKSVGFHKNNDLLQNSYV